MRREDVELSKSKSLSPEKKIFQASFTTPTVAGPRTVARTNTHSQTGQGLLYRFFKVEKALATNEIRGQARRITLISTLASSLTSNRHERVAIVVNAVSQVRWFWGFQIAATCQFFRLKRCASIWLGAQHRIRVEVNVP